MIPFFAKVGLITMAVAGSIATIGSGIAGIILAVLRSRDKKSNMDNESTEDRREIT